MRSSRRHPYRAASAAWSGPALSTSSNGPISFDPRSQQLRIVRAGAFPSTYIERHVDGVAHVQTTVPVDGNGELVLRFPGMTLAMVPDGPPQSARPTLISMTAAQLERLSALRFRQGEHQELCQRVFNSGVRAGADDIQAAVLATDMVVLDKALAAGETGDWQDLFREIFSQDTAAPPHA